jgi:thioredoxin 1
LTPVENFADGDWQAVLASPLPVVVGFWADWCVPSRGVQPALETLARRHENALRVGLLNVDENLETPRRYAICGLPTLLMLRRGEEALRRVGLVSPEALLTLFQP